MTRKSRKSLDEFYPIHIHCVVSVVSLQTFWDCLTKTPRRHCQINWKATKSVIWKVVCSVLSRLSLNIRSILSPRFHSSNTAWKKLDTRSIFCSFCLVRLLVPHTLLIILDWSVLIALSQSSCPFYKYFHSKFIYLNFKNVSIVNDCVLEPTTV